MWMDIDPIHIPWRVIAGDRTPQHWTMSDIEKQMNPLRPILPFELATADREKNRLGTVTVGPIHYETYAQIRTTSNGLSTVFVHFGDTGENVILDTDILFLWSAEAFLIQAILRRSQRQERKIFVKDPEEDPDPWSGNS